MQTLRPMSKTCVCTHVHMMSAHVYSQCADLLNAETQRTQTLRQKGVRTQRVAEYEKSGNTVDVNNIFVHVCYFKYVLL